MPYQPTTNFRDSNNVDLGKKLVSKEYLLEVYGSILESLGNSGLTVSPALWGWGSNHDGELGINTNENNTTNTKSTPVTTFAGGTNWRQVATGNQYSAAIKNDGTLWVWGRGMENQLGINVNDRRLTPVTTFAGGSDWKQVACGGNGHVMAGIKTNGTLWLWGTASNGKLGTNDTVNRPTPVTTFAGGNNWKQVFVGENHTAAIKTDGSLWVWGSQVSGKLGTNLSSGDVLTPVTTFAGGNDWKQVFGGPDFTGAIKTDGSLWMWGHNDRVGTNGGGNKNTPVTTFIGGNDWKSGHTSFSSSAYHVGAIKTDGTLWMWGGPQNGRLGDNQSSTTKLTPITTFAGGNNWKSVSVGGSHTAAIKTDGTLWVWGGNTMSQLGINDGIDRLTPVNIIANNNDWKSISVGSGHAIAIRSVDYI